MNISPFLGATGWGAVFLLLLYVSYIIVMRSQGRSMQISTFLVVTLPVVGIVLIMLSAGLVFVPAELRAVVVTIFGDRGLRHEPLPPGLHFVVPFAEKAVWYSIANQNYTMSIAPHEGDIYGDDAIEARTADGQKVRIDATIIFRIDPSKVIGTHIRWQERYVNGIVRPAARGVIRDVVSQFGVEEVYSLRREEMTSLVRERLRDQLSGEGLELQDFILRNIGFTVEYGASIEQKQIAEQNALRAEFQVLEEKQIAESARARAEGTRDANITEAEGEARSIVLLAQAEAEALRLVSEALAANPDLLTFRYIEKLAPTINTALLPANAPFIIDIQGLTRQEQGMSISTSSSVPEP